MEGNDVCKIYIMVSIAADMLACGDPGFVALPCSLALDASLEVVRYNRKRIFSFH